MRPVRLTLQAFGPYPDRVVIDFRDAVGAGLFGIYGQTGSGKSTIFSAMTFALFGEAAKSEQDATSLRSDHADPTVLTEVEFVFDVGDQRCVALRRPEQSRPKARGEGETRSAHEAFLFDATGLSLDEITDGQRGKIIAEKKVREVDQAISQMLGYGAEQFRQIVLLPQGRFEKFLAVKTKERLEILRELFDVSLYEALMADLKSEADAAERQLREERALCSRQLAAEGFDTPDALQDGIKAAEARVETLKAAEEAAKASTLIAETEWRQAEAIEEKFKAAERAQGAFTELEARKADIEALGERLRQTERARSLLDVEDRANEAGREAREAETSLQSALDAVAQATKAAEAAARSLQNEEQRSSEGDLLRRKLDDLDRYDHILQAAADSAEAVATAQDAERKAENAHRARLDRLKTLKDLRGSKSETLKAARLREAQRVEISASLTALAVQHAAAEAYETALKEITSAEAEVARQNQLSGAASLDVREARAKFEAAEQRLAAAQALHLASKLESGAPCPVCGATDHPAPATGEIDNAGLDKIFRDARTGLQIAETAYGQANQALAASQATLSERQMRLGKLDPPPETAKVLAASMAAGTASLKALGPKIDLTAAEAEIERLDGEITVLERERDEGRDHLEACRNTAIEARTARDGKLAEIPETLRDPAALAARRDEVDLSLKALLSAKARAEDAARTTREALVAAQTHHMNAANAAATFRDRHRLASDIFTSRLADAGLSEDAFHILKPGIKTLEADKETVETFWRKLQSAGDAASAAAKEVEGIARPDLPALEDVHISAAKQSAQATEARIGAKNRADQLAKLHADLENTLRKLEEAETRSGPLRALAALVDGQNPLRLNLETFAIGAMFDQVLDAANLRLGPMTANRYTLEREVEGAGRAKRGLGIQVFDIYTGKARGTGTLSGGETFIAALALALGLADVVESASGKVRLDTIFIDEGFGSLDTENGSGTLDQVLSVLSSLVSQTRAVGLISHVPLVQEAIPNGFYIRKGPAGSSIEERGLI